MPAQHETPLDSVAATVAILALFVVVGTTLTAVVQGRPTAPVAAPVEPVVRVLADPAPLEPTGFALVDAIPWGRVVRLESATGKPYPLPRPAETPLILELPLGDWIVALSNPDHEEERLCELSIENGLRPECRVEFEPLSVDQYFRDSGWWR